ncbi:MAG: ribbon-helix-helix domain-containing protein [bacterium]
MRSIMNVSLPEEMVKTIKREVKRGHFATTSEFLRYLVRLWNAGNLAKELETRRRDFKAGKGRKLKALADL